MEGELTVTKFRGVLIEETQRLTRNCAEWRDIANTSQGIPEDIEGDIMVAIGQAELLMKERFSQFSSLIDDCEFERGEKKTTCQDLQGFWDIVYFQVEDVLKKFSNLTKMKNNGWKEPERHLPQVKKTKPILGAKTVTGKPCGFNKPKIGGFKGGSSIRAHILAARQKMLSQKIQDEKLQSPFTVKMSTVNEAEKKNTKENTPPNSMIINKENSAERSPKKKTEAKRKKGNKVFKETTVFDAGFFKIETPIKEIATVKKWTPVRANERVLSSSGLRERVLNTPVVHKDYSPCMRITRSMKLSGLKSRRLNLDAE